ncbi:gag-pol polyprotein [Lasius niger]|uniref:Gag-pol polyprotein n=1 Tax=Lasius niger TaxID=67767 RepID=A0A0J7K8U2_LASNI|nr:gag-pol polyprotein [Lasius niger]
MTANDNSAGPRRLFMVDRNTKTRYLIDTGSDVSVYPRLNTKGRQRAETYQLFAANGSTITTYWTITLQPDLGLRRAFPWRFIIADVIQPIISSNFLCHYLLQDIQNRKLLDGTTGLTTPGTASNNTTGSVKAVTPTATTTSCKNSRGLHNRTANKQEQSITQYITQKLHTDNQRRADHADWHQKD